MREIIAYLNADSNDPVERMLQEKERGISGMNS